MSGDVVKVVVSWSHSPALVAVEVVVVVVDDEVDVAVDVEVVVAVVDVDVVVVVVVVVDVVVVVVVDVDVVVVVGVGVVDEVVVEENWLLGGSRCGAYCMFGSLWVVVRWSCCRRRLNSCRARQGEKRQGLLYP